MPPIFQQETKIDTPSTEAKGPICRVPLTSLNFHVLAFSARVSVLNLGTAMQVLCIIFSLILGISDFHCIDSEGF